MSKSVCSKERREMNGINESIIVNFENEPSLRAAFDGPLVSVHVLQCQVPVIVDNVDYLLSQRMFG